MKTKAAIALATVTAAVMLSACGAPTVDSAELETAVPEAMFAGASALGSPFSASAGVSGSDLKSPETLVLSSSFIGNSVLDSAPAEACLADTKSFLESRQSADDQVHTSLDRGGVSAAEVEVVRYLDAAAATAALGTFKALVKSCANNGDSRTDIASVSNFDIKLKDTQGMIVFPKGESTIVRIFARQVGRQLVNITLPDVSLADSQMATFSEAFFKKLD